MAEDLHDDAGERAQLVSGVRPVPRALQHGARVLLCTARSAATAARPSRRDASTSGTPRLDISASLTVSLARSGQPSSAETALANVVLPLPGGPDTTTYADVRARSVTGSSCSLRRLRQTHALPVRSDSGH